MSQVIHWHKKHIWVLMTAWTVCLILAPQRCTAATPLCQLSIKGHSAMYGKQPANSVSHFDQSAAAAEAGKLTHITTYYTKDGCLAGIKQSHGPVAGTGQLLGYQEGLQYTLLTLQADECISRIDIKYDQRCIRYLRWYTNTGRTLAVGSMDSGSGSKMAAVIPVQSSWQLVSVGGTHSNGQLHQLQFVWGDTNCQASSIQTAILAVGQQRQPPAITAAAPDKALLTRPSQQQAGAAIAVAGGAVSDKADISDIASVFAADSHTAPACKLVISGYSSFLGIRKAGAKIIDYSKLVQHGPIKQLSLYHDKQEGCIKGVKLLYSTESDTAPAMIGSTAGAMETALILKPGERITGVAYKQWRCIEYIRVITNAGRSIAAGSHDSASQTVVLKANKGHMQLVGFKGLQDRDTGSKPGVLQQLQLVWGYKQCSDSATTPIAAPATPAGAATLPEAIPAASAGRNTAALTDTAAAPGTAPTAAATPPAPTATSSIFADIDRSAQQQQDALIQHATPAETAQSNAMSTAENQSSVYTPAEQQWNATEKQPAAEQQQREPQDSVLAPIKRQSPNVAAAAAAATNPMAGTVIPQQLTLQAPPATGQHQSQPEQQAVAPGQQQPQSAIQQQLLLPSSAVQSAAAAEQQQGGSQTAVAATVQEPAGSIQQQQELGLQPALQTVAAGLVAAATASPAAAVDSNQHNTTAAAAGHADNGPMPAEATLSPAQAHEMLQQQPTAATGFEVLGSTVIPEPGDFALVDSQGTGQPGQLQQQQQQPGTTRLQSQSSTTPLAILLGTMAGQQPVDKAQQPSVMVTTDESQPPTSAAAAPTADVRNAAANTAVANNTTTGESSVLSRAIAVLQLLKMLKSNQSMEALQQQSSTLGLQLGSSSMPGSAADQAVVTVTPVNVTARSAPWLAVPMGRGAPVENSAAAATASVAAAVPGLTQQQSSQLAIHQLSGSLWPLLSTAEKMMVTLAEPSNNTTAGSVQQLPHNALPATATAAAAAAAAPNGGTQPTYKAMVPPAVFCQSQMNRCNPEVPASDPAYCRAVLPFTQSQCAGGCCVSSGKCSSSCKFSGLGAEVPNMVCRGLGRSINGYGAVAAVAGNTVTNNGLCQNLGCSLAVPGCLAGQLGGSCVGKVVALGPVASLHPEGVKLLGYPCLDIGPSDATLDINGVAVQGGYYVAALWSVCDCNGTEMASIANSSNTTDVANITKAVQALVSLFDGGKHSNAATAGSKSTSIGSTTASSDSSITADLGVKILIDLLKPDSKGSTAKAANPFTSVGTWLSLLGALDSSTDGAAAPTRAGNNMRLAAKAEANPAPMPQFAAAMPVSSSSRTGITVEPFSSMIGGPKTAGSVTSSAPNLFSGLANWLGFKSSTSNDAAKLGAVNPAGGLGYPGQYSQYSSGEADIADGTADDLFGSQVGNSDQGVAEPTDVSTVDHADSAPDNNSLTQAPGEASYMVAGDALPNDAPVIAKARLSNTTGTSAGMPAAVEVYDAAAAQPTGELAGTANVATRSSVAVGALPNAPVVAKVHLAQSSGSQPPSSNPAGSQVAYIEQSEAAEAALAGKGSSAGAWPSGPTAVASAHPAQSGDSLVSSSSPPVAVQPGTELKGAADEAASSARNFTLSGGSRESTQSASSQIPSNDPTVPLELPANIVSDETAMEATSLTPLSEEGTTYMAAGNDVPMEAVATPSDEKVSGAIAAASSAIVASDVLHFTAYGADASSINHLTLPPAAAANTLDSSSSNTRAVRDASSNSTSNGSVSLLGSSMAPPAAIGGPGGAAIAFGSASPAVTGAGDNTTVINSKDSTGGDLIVHSSSSTLAASNSTDGGHNSSSLATSSNTDGGHNSSSTMHNSGNTSSDRQKNSAALDIRQTGHAAHTSQSSNASDDRKLPSAAVTSSSSLLRGSNSSNSSYHSSATVTGSSTASAIASVMSSAIGATDTSATKSSNTALQQSSASNTVMAQPSQATSPTKAVVMPAAAGLSHTVAPTAVTNKPAAIAVQSAAAAVKADVINIPAAAPAAAVKAAATATPRTASEPAALVSLTNVSVRASGLLAPLTTADIAVKPLFQPVLTPVPPTPSAPTAAAGIGPLPVSSLSPADQVPAKHAGTATLPHAAAVPIASPPGPEAAGGAAAAAGVPLVAPSSTKPAATGATAIAGTLLVSAPNVLSSAVASTSLALAVPAPGATTIIAAAAAASPAVAPAVAVVPSASVASKATVATALGDVSNTTATGGISTDTCGSSNNITSFMGQSIGASSQEVQQTAYVPSNAAISADTVKRPAMQSHTVVRTKASTQGSAINATKGYTSNVPSRTSTGTVVPANSTVAVVISSSSTTTHASIHASSSSSNNTSSGSINGSSTAVNKPNTDRTPNEGIPVTAGSSFTAVSHSSHNRSSATSNNMGAALIVSTNPLGNNPLGDIRLNNAVSANAASVVAKAANNSAVNRPSEAAAIKAVATLASPHDSSSSNNTGSSRSSIASDSILSTASSSSSSSLGLFTLPAAAAAVNDSTTYTMPGPWKPWFQSSPASTPAADNDQGATYVISGLDSSSDGGGSVKGLASVAAAATTPGADEGTTYTMAGPTGPYSSHASRIGQARNVNTFNPAAYTPFASSDLIAPRVAVLQGDELVALQAAVDVDDSGAVSAGTSSGGSNVGSNSSSSGAGGSSSGGDGGTSSSTGRKGSMQGSEQPALQEMADAGGNGNSSGSNDNRAARSHNNNSGTEPIAVELFDSSNAASTNSGPSSNNSNGSISSIDIGDGSSSRGHMGGRDTIDSVMNITDVLPLNLTGKQLAESSGIARLPAGFGISDAGAQNGTVDNSTSQQADTSSSSSVAGQAPASSSSSRSVVSWKVAPHSSSTSSSSSISDQQTPLERSSNNITSAASQQIAAYYSSNSTILVGQQAAAVSLNSSSVASQLPAEGSSANISNVASQQPAATSSSSNSNYSNVGSQQVWQPELLVTSSLSTSSAGSNSLFSSTASRGGSSTVSGRGGSTSTRGVTPLPSPAKPHSDVANVSLSYNMSGVDTREDWYDGFLGSASNSSTDSGRGVVATQVLPPPAVEEALYNIDVLSAGESVPARENWYNGDAAASKSSNKQTSADAQLSLVDNKSFLGRRLQHFIRLR